MPNAPRKIITAAAIFSLLLSSSSALAFTPPENVRPTPIPQPSMAVFAIIAYAIALGFPIFAYVVARLIRSRPRRTQWLFASAVVLTLLVVIAWVFNPEMCVDTLGMTEAYAIQQCAIPALFVRENPMVYLAFILSLPFWVFAVKSKLSKNPNPPTP